jgi:hypothetical protein
MQHVLSAPYIRAALSSSLPRRALALAGFARGVVYNPSTTDIPEASGCVAALSGALLKSAKAAKADFLDGRPVDFREVEKLATQLATIPEERLVPGFLVAASSTAIPESEVVAVPPELLAFWLNVYNALVIHATIRICQDAGMRYHQQLSVRELLDGHFFKKASYRIAGRVFTLEDIEHGVLRGNRASPSLLNGGTGGLGQFYPWDDRRMFTFGKVDIRIHFALNCGARSCPAIRAYTPEKVHSQLDIAAQTFFKTGGIRLEGDTVILSPIIMWFSWDFGYTTNSRLAAVLPFVDPHLRDAIAAVAHQHGLTWGDYDWTFG